MIGRTTRTKEVCGIELNQLLEQIRSGDRESRIRAAEELANFSEPRVVDALVKTLEDRDWDLQIATASALARIGDPRAVKPLFDLMESWRWHPDRGVALAQTLLQFKEAAIRPLAEMRTGSLSSARGFLLEALGAEALIALLTDSRVTVQRKVAHAFGGVADLRVVEPLVEKLFRWPRPEIIDALGRVGDARAVEPLIAALKRDWKWSAARALGEIGDARALMPLMDMVREGGNAGGAAAQALAKFGSAGVEPLLALLRDEWSWVRAEAAESLGDIGDLRAIDPLRAALRDEESEVREKAAKALELLHWHPENAADRAWYSVAQARWEEAVNVGEEAVDPLVAALGHPQASVRQHAAEALGALGDVRAIEPLHRLVDRDRDAHVHRAAAAALLATEGLAAAEAPIAAHGQAHPEPSEHTSVDSRRFPLDVLLISEHMHADASASHGLIMYLNRHPAVRSYGITSNEEQSMSYLQNGLVNTIFVDPCLPTEVWGGDIEQFIRNVRGEFPNVVFALYTDPDCLERFCRVHPRFRHYFYLDRVVEPDRATSSVKSATTQAVDDVLRRCEEWYSTRYQYDVGISFAGEDRRYAEEIADQLRAMSARIFYDAYEEADLLGKNLYTHLHTIYTEKCRYCVILISQAYAKKVWTSHERVAAQERALQERDREYILPVRIDNTALPGLSNVIAYVSIDRGTSKIADLISRKLWTDPDAPKYYIGESLY